MIRADPRERDGGRSRPSRVLWRGTGAILAAGLVFALAALLAAWLTDPIYRAEARLSVPGGVRTVDDWIESPGALSAVGSRLGQRDEDLTPRRSLLGELRRIVGGERDEGAGAPADWLRTNLSTWEDEEAGLVVIGVSARDPVLAARAANAVAAEIAPRQLPDTGDRPAEPPAAALAASGDLGSQIEKAKARLQAAEQRLAAADERANPESRSETAGNPAWAEATNDLARVRSGMAGVERSERELEAGTIEAWPALVRLEAERSRLVSDIAGLLRTLPVDHPRVGIAQLRIADLDGELTAAKEKIRTALRSQLAALQTREAALSRRVQEVSAGRPSSAAPEVDREMLVQAVDAERRTLDAYLLRASGLAADASSSGEEVAGRSAPAGGPRIVAEAAVPTEPDSPRILPVSAAAGCLGMITACATLLLSTWTGRLGQPAADAARMPAIPDGRRAGPVETAGTAGNRDRTGAAIGRPDSIGLEDVLGALSLSGVSRALIASPGGPRLKRTGIDLARHLALRSYAVVLVDLSPDQTAARSMGVSPGGAGLLDLLEGRASYADIVRRDFATTVDIVASGRSGAPAEPSSRRTRDALDFIEKTYECMLIDCGGLPASDVRCLMDEDAALLVAVDGSSEQDLATLVDELAVAGLDDFILVSDKRTDAPA